MKRTQFLTFALLILLAACNQPATLPPPAETSPIPDETKIPATETPRADSPSQIETSTLATETLLPTATQPPPNSSQEPTEVAFTLSEQVLGDTRSFSVVIKDVDLDNDNDVLIANYIGSSKLWLNNGNGGFAESGQRFYISEVHAAGIDDLNGDTFPDIILLSHATHGKVYFNDGAGSFDDSGQDVGLPSDNPGMIVMGDVENDGDVDAFISYPSSPNRLWLNDGDGYFEKTDTEFGGSGKSHNMELADFNGDGFLDLFLCMSDQPDQVWMNDGSGNYLNSGQELGSPAGDDYADSKDLDGDGDFDVVVANSVEGAKVWLNQNNTGVFAEAGAYFEAGAWHGELLDADLDGDFDLVTTHLENGNQLLLNNGSGSFTSVGAIFGNSRVLSLATGQLDADETNDVLLGKLEGVGGNTIYFNRP